jgi:hypothetical protein
VRDERSIADDGLGELRHLFLLSLDIILSKKRASFFTHILINFSQIFLNPKGKPEGFLLIDYLVDDFQD